MPDKIFIRPQSNCLFTLVVHYRCLASATTEVVQNYAKIINQTFF